MSVKLDLMYFGSIFQLLVEDPNLSEFFREANSCTLVDSEPDCTHPCTWDEEEGLCQIRIEYVLKKAVEVSPEKSIKEC